ncbi:MAG: sigma-70 family RNA polymerase sigma factor [Byssovorax sp.]
MTLTALSPDPVHALLDRALRGHADAQEELIRKVLLPVADAAASRHLFGRARRHFEKEDVVQGVLIHLVEDDWKKLRRFDPKEGSLVAFLMSVVKNWIRDHIRRLPPPEPVADPDEGGGPTSSPESAAQRREIWSRLLDQLDERELLLFRWVHLEGVPRAEVAARLQVSMEAVYKQIQRMEDKVKSTVSRPESAVRTPAGKSP